MKQFPMWQYGLPGDDEILLRDAANNSLREFFAADGQCSFDDVFVGAGYQCVMIVLKNLRIERHRPAIERFVRGSIPPEYPCHVVKAY